MDMARISINKASTEFDVSRNTLYKHIKLGKLTRDSEGNLDTSDLIRLYGSHVHSEQSFTSVDSEEFTTIEHLKNEITQLKQLLAVNEMMVNQLQRQVEDLKADKQQLFSEMVQRRIETEASTKGFLRKFFK